MLMLERHVPLISDPSVVLYEYYPEAEPIDLPVVVVDSKGACRLPRRQTSIIIGGLLRVLATGDIVLHDPWSAGFQAAAEDLKFACFEAYSIRGCPELRRAFYDDGPLAGLGEITVETMLAVLDRAREIDKEAVARREAKREALEHRRRQFSSRRPRLVLLMLAAGVEHRCAHCRTTENLTVDHILAVSRGGSDELDNLQFLCQPCNSRKGDR